MTIIDADFIEEDYISAVETMISRSAYAHNKKFIEISRISQDQERGLGYDGVLTAIVPFYVQFKRSQFYTPAYSGKLSKDRQKVFGKPLNSGFLAFKLHRDRHTQMYEQHNAMWKLSQYSSAAYVAPLFYKKRDLTTLKRREVDLPWEYRQLKVRDRVFRMGYPLKAVRTFKDSIVVIPHREVKDKEPSHHYTYDRAIKNVAFHSDVEFVESPQYNLADFVSSVLERASRLEAGFNQMPMDGSLEVIQHLPELFGLTWRSRKFRSMVSNYLVEIGVIFKKLPNNLESYLSDELSIQDRFYFLEEILRQEFGIIQYTVRLDA